MLLPRLALFVSLSLFEIIPAYAQGTGRLAADFQPDPVSVRRYGPAYRYPQAGWTVLHIEGDPYPRGYQHGRLMASEIAAAVRCFAALQSPKAPMEGWKNTRSLVKALFVRRYEKEFLEEMKGIADGAAASGARIDNRPMDLADIVALNAWPEIETLDSALEATPTGLEGIRFPHGQPQAMPDPKPMHCSAFAATGPATADGKIVFGHITMFSLYPSLFYNVWLDVKPAQGHRVLMQSYPGGIQSGLDYYMNDAGLLVCETTLAQTRFDIHGMSVASRIRQALQYADSIDRAVEILKKGNNGLYTNEWLLADVKTNEIAMFELGTAKSKLYRSSKNEWFGGTEGFYWGCNNTKDLEVRLETVSSTGDRPANMVWHPSDRDKAWVRLFDRHRGGIDVDFGKKAFTTPPIAAFHSVDAKFTTSDLAKGLRSWALFGPPLGRTWQPTLEERRTFPEVKPMVSNPWTILHGSAPSRVNSPTVKLEDVHEKIEEKAADAEEEKRLFTQPAWYGTLLARADGDVWLAAGFAEYEKVFALEKALREKATSHRLTSKDRDRLAVALFAFRSEAMAAARTMGDVPLGLTRSDIRQSDWYRQAVGKGVCFLHQLRLLLGDKVFVEAMETFGKQNAGREVTTLQFQNHVEKLASGDEVRRRELKGFFDSCLKQPSLPVLQLGKTRVTAKSGGFLVEGVVQNPNKMPGFLVEVTVETSKGEVTKKLLLTGSSTTFSIHALDQPKRLVLDKYGWSAKANGGFFSIESFQTDLEKTLIVYGTVDEVATNKEAAESVQRAIREKWSNMTVPIVADLEATEQQLKHNHLILMGRPDTNRIADRFRAGFPVALGARSFTVRGETYAHPLSAIVAAAENPLDRRFSVVVIAGMCGESTLLSAPILMRKGLHAGEVLVLGHGSRPRSLVLPAPELVQELEKP